MLVVNFYFLAVSGSESDYNDRPSQQRFCFFFLGSYASAEFNSTPDYRTLIGSHTLRVDRVHHYAAPTTASMYAKLCFCTF